MIGILHGQGDGQVGLLLRCLSKMGAEQQIGPYCTDGHTRNAMQSKRGWYSIRRNTLDKYWFGIRLVLYRALLDMMARGARYLPMPRTTIVRAQERHCQRRSPVKSEDIQNGEVLHVTEK